MVENRPKIEKIEFIYCYVISKEKYHASFFAGKSFKLNHCSCFLLIYFLEKK